MPRSPIAGAGSSSLDPDRRGALLSVGALVLASPLGAAVEATSRNQGDPARGPQVVTSERKKTFQAIPGETMKVQIGNDLVGGAFTVTESLIAPGTATPLHFHATADETFLILTGELDVVCGGQWVRAGPQSTVLVPRGAHHGFINRSNADVRCLAIFSPGGMEALFAQLDSTPLEQWADLARRYDTYIVGPPVGAGGRG